MEPKQREHWSILAINIGLAANVILAALKVYMGIRGHSSALLADGINSTSDVAYLVVIRIFMGLARKPADAEHPYGHSQMESIAALVVGAFVLTTAVAIFWDAVNKVYDLWSGLGDPGGVTMGALAAALFTVGLKIGLAFITQWLGRRTGNPVVKTLAYDHRNDIFAGIGVCIGIVCSRMGYTWVDPLAGAVVALVILRTGIHILNEASGDLTDAVPGRELHNQLAAVVRGVAGVRELEELMAHRFGPYLVLNVIIGIDGTLSVTEGDRIATEVEQALVRELEMVQRVHVHYHPAKADA